MLHILSDPILDSVPGSSLEFIYLSEVSGRILRKYSHDHFLRTMMETRTADHFSDAPHPRTEYPHANEDGKGRNGTMAGFEPGTFGVRI